MNSVLLGGQLIRTMFDLRNDLHLKEGHLLQSGKTTKRRVRSGGYRYNGGGCHRYHRGRALRCMLCRLVYSFGGYIHVYFWELCHFDGRGSDAFARWVIAKRELLPHGVVFLTSQVGLLVFRFVRL